MPRIAALVPMRHTSERVPGKNYRQFAGRPLYHHIVASLLASGAVDEVMIDTDSPFILEDCPVHFPQVRLIPRPEHLREGTIPMNDVLLHDIEQIEADFYLQTHSTNPLLRAETITRAVRAFLDRLPEKDSLFGVTRLQTRLYDEAGSPVNHDPAVLLRTQDLPPLFEENSNIYIFTAETLRARGNRIGARPMLFEIDRLEALDIDDEEGFQLAEALALRT